MEAVAGLAGRSAEELRKDILAASGIFLFAFALYLLPAVRHRPLLDTPELRVATVAREMVRSGEYVVPRVGGELRLNKPPLPYWLAAGGALLLGGSEEVSRTAVMNRATLLPSALLGALALFLVVFYGCVVFGRPTGVMAGLLLGSSYLVCHFCQTGYGDATLLFTCAAMFCSAAWLVSSARPGFLAAAALGIALGLAILTKGHIPVLLLAGPLAVEVLIRRRFNGRKVLLFAVALLVAAAVAAPWFVVLEKRAPGAWQALRGEMAEGVFPTGHAQSDRWVYYLYRLAGGLLPWTLLLVSAWPICALRRRERNGDAAGSALLAREQGRFFLLAFVIGLLGFYALPKQQDYYLLPLLPPLALVSGYVLSGFKTPGGVGEETLAWTQLAFGFAGGLGVASLPFWPVKWLADTEASQQALSALGEPLGMAALAAAGLVFFVVHFYCARQWVEGRPVPAVIAMAAVAYLGLAAWSWHWAESTQAKVAPLSAETPRLRTKLREMGEGTRVYSIGVAAPLLAYYLGLDRAVLTQRDLSKEQPSAAAPQRALVVSREHVQGVQECYGLAEAENRVLLTNDKGVGAEPYVIFRVPPEGDWPGKAGLAIQAQKQKRRHDGGEE